MSDRRIYVAGTCDTKGAELRYVRDLIAARGLVAVVVDVSTAADGDGGDIPPGEVARYHPDGPQAVFTGDRGRSIAAMAVAFDHYLRARDDVAGVIGLGGSGGTALVAPAMQALPVGVPKLLVSTVASGNVAPYVGASDIAMMYSVTDLAGLNRISRTVLANAAHAIAGMAQTRLEISAGDKDAVGITMFGVTTQCVNRLVSRLEVRHDCLVFHATGTGGQSMEKLVDSGMVTGVLDVTTTEVADLLMGGIMACSRDQVRCHRANRDPLCRLLRRGRHGEFRRAGHRAGALPRSQPPCPQPADHADADHGGRECADRTLDRRAPQSMQRAGALPAAAGEGSRYSMHRDRCSTIPKRTRRCSRRSSRPCGRPITVASSEIPAAINDDAFADALLDHFHDVMGDA